MGQRPSIKHSIDRIDNNGNYDPKNCRWASQYEQCQNMRSTRLLSFAGEQLSLSEWARRIGIARKSLQKRLAKYPIEITLGTPKTLGGWDHKLV